MKNLLLLILFSALHAALFSQVQIGMVREQNSNRKPIGAVQVNFSEAVPTTSDDNGIFRLVFKEKKPGDFIFYNEIKKEGYELVNGKELEMLKLGNDDHLKVDIILAKYGTVDAAKKEYYQVSDKALMYNFNQKKQDLQAKIKSAEISQQDFLVKFNLLQEQFDTQKKSLHELSEKFARVNFDDVSIVYREALDLFKEGKIDEAIRKLEDADFLTRSEKHIIERNRIENASGDLNEQNVENEKGIIEDSKAALQQARIYVLKNQPLDALPFFELLLVANSNNLDILQECSDFFLTNNLDEKAIPVLKQIAIHPDANQTQKAKAANNYNILSQKKQ